MIKAIIFDFYGVIDLGGLPNKPLLEIIKHDLKPRYKIGILSNAGRDLNQLIGLEYIDLFDEIATSHQHAMVKPNPDFYKLIAQKLDVRPSDCIYVDDNQQHCDGAKAIGMKSILYKGVEALKPELSRILADSNN